MRVKYVGIVDICFAVWRGRCQEYYPWPPCQSGFFLFTCVIEQSERSSELALRKEVMSIQRRCFTQVSSLLGNGSLLDMDMGLGFVT